MREGRKGRKEGFASDMYVYCSRPMNKTVCLNVFRKISGRSLRCVALRCIVRSRSSKRRALKSRLFGQEPKI